MRVRDIIGKYKNSVYMKKNIANIVKHADVSEKMIERYLCDSVKQMGGVCLKYSNAGMVGYPDRICLLSGGVVFWVELKSKDGRLNEVQKIRIRQLRSMGHTVNVCRSKEDVDKVLEPYKCRDL
jgi:hypothetical protein